MQKVCLFTLPVRLWPCCWRSGPWHLPRHRLWRSAGWLVLSAMRRRQGCLWRRI